MRLNIRIDMRRNALRLLTPYGSANPTYKTQPQLFFLSDLHRFFVPLAYMSFTSLLG